MTLRLARVAPLLFGSGACALIYQVAWLREMRLIFGASTAASAAVLAIFMGGLGLGSALLGRRADRHPRPLAFYANLELMIAASAALTPGLVWIARQAYVALGGSVVLGLGLATITRLLLATLVLCVPTILMGGTLPAAAKAVETDEDINRRHLAVLYGTNTLGAVTGAFVSTFFMLEVLGTRSTLWCAALFNVLVGITARAMARRQGTRPAAPPAIAADEATTAVAPAGFVLGAAAAVGFSFLLMELVWYRMLGPLLGGSSFTFGLILAVALFGIGVGGVAYALTGNQRRATLTGFALTCSLEAVCVAYPYALGDRVAFLAILLRPLGSLGFGGLVLSWALVTGLVVLPAAVISGIQFPLLIALLGRGGERVGRHVGQAYAWNTLGAIAGSLAGGFGLLPGLSAPGAWSAVVIILVALGVVATVLGLRAERQLLRTALPVAAALTAILMLRATGPTAAWRHSPIGAGRADQAHATRNSLQDWANARRRHVRWQVDGVESSVALDAGNSYAFVVNGKTDGNARNDAPTQVMTGLVGAILHPQARRALVVGLGTGSSAGWLGAVPTMERVDVVELEPAIVDVARACTPVNQDVLANPKVRIHIADAREVLLTTPERYDLIFSEPSNPYRAGIASLFTREFYESAALRLAEGGIFLQWLQAYEVDSQTVRTVFATLASVFPSVEVWRTADVDLLLLGTMKPIRYDLPALRARVQQEPFKTALAVAWRTTSVEGFLARYVAGPSLVSAIAQLEGSFLNTDDQTLVEYAMARSVGRSNLFNIADLRQLARARREDRPPLGSEALDWAGVEDERIALYTAVGVAPPLWSDLTADQQSRAKAQIKYLEGNSAAALAAWRAQSREPVGLVELLVLGEVLADRGDEAAARYIESLRHQQPIEADAMLGHLRWRQGRLQEAAAALTAAFIAYRSDPWPLPHVLGRALEVATAVAAADKQLGEQLLEALTTPFAILALDEERRSAVLKIATQLNFDKYCLPALEALEPHAPWQREVLRARVRCYRAAGHPRVEQAEEDWGAFLAGEPAAFGRGLEAAAPEAAAGVEASTSTKRTGAQ
ncbi:MAG: fused MFS/spermidine synthase [Deltaproteobacteria bacterium]|nr:fused MFS/spermidine synthase [Deltaproteobacteria bacterium]